MSARVTDGLTRSSRTRSRRRAHGACPDCGATIGIVVGRRRCEACCGKRRAIRKVGRIPVAAACKQVAPVAGWRLEVGGWQMVGRG